MLVFWSLIWNSVVLSICLLLFCFCFFTIHEHWHLDCHCCLLTEGGFSDDGFWRTVKYFNYTHLRKAFQTALLNKMEKKIGPSFRKTKSTVYSKDKEGFYVYAKSNLCDTDTVIKYISRYLGRPTIASSRINSYDGQNVTFHYNRHEDDTYVQKTLPVLDFIQLLIQHIPKKHFKMTRYYGLYARWRELDKTICKAISPCKHKMVFMELYRNYKRVPLEELYEKVMAPYRCHSKEPPGKYA